MSLSLPFPSLCTEILNGNVHTKDNRGSVETNLFLFIILFRLHAARYPPAFGAVRVSGPNSIDQPVQLLIRS